jgi:hypothetical protein
MNIRQVESVIYHQFIEEDIKEDNLVNEGIIRNAINKMSSRFIQTALADEIEKGKELEKSIKEALDGLDKGFEEIKKTIDKKSKDNSKLDAIEKVKEAIKAVQSQAFDTLTMIGSEGEIDFAGFMGSATVAAAANFGILFTPIRSLFITRKAYKYFLGIIKQTIRRNLLIIQLNFDQFENLILQKSFETDEDSETLTKSNTLHDVISTLQAELCGKDSRMFKKSKSKEMKEYLEAFKKAQDIAIKQNRENARNNPLRSLWEDQHNNTYTRTLEQIKQYINDDSQKELDALKNSITKMAGNDVELIPYGELLISAAEEYAIHTNHGINNNFIKMSSVFNLENQKKLIEMIQKTQDENEKEIEKEIEKKKRKIDIKEAEEKVDEGKKLYEEKLKDSTEVYTIDKFEDEFSESDIKSLKAFFNSEEGKEPYKELTDKNPLYKYLIDIDMKVLNDFLSAINELKIIEIQDMDDFFDKIVKKEQTLYYMMAERSIKDAVKSNTPDDYFGFDIDEDSDVDTKDNVLSEKAFEKETTTSGDKTTNFSKVDILFNNIIKTSKTKTGKGYSFNKKSKYFLTFNGSGNNLFNILHNDFKTDFFKEDGEYKSEISIDSKLDIMKLIYKNLKIGKSISTQFAEYLSILETHMLLKEPEKSWFVIKNNEGLKDCFDRDSKKIVNKHAFVEISDDDFSDIKTFLTKYHSLSDNDFNIVEADKKENE